MFATPEARRIAELSQAMRVRRVLQQMPVFDQDAGRLDEVIRTYFEETPFVTLPEDAMLRPDLFGPLDGDPAYEALFICKVEFLGQPQLFEEAKRRLLRIQPALAEAASLHYSAE